MEEDVSDRAPAHLREPPVHRLNGVLTVFGIGERTHGRDAAGHRGGGSGGEVVDEGAL